MEDKSSRHRQVATYKRQIPGTELEVTLYQPRLRREQTADSYHFVSMGERLDILAYRQYNNPHLFWLLADSNPNVAIEHLDEAGRKLAIGKDQT